jgi:hypothetical protein
MREVFDYEQSLAILDAALPFAPLRAALTCFGFARFPDFRFGCRNAIKQMHSYTH